MTAPTIASTLAALPAGLTVLRGSEVTGFRGKVYRWAGEPSGQCFGSVMVIHDDLWLPGREWDFYTTVQHELVHHWQSTGWLFPLFIVLYVLAPPWIGFAPRALLELPAYRATLRGLYAQWASRGSTQAQCAPALRKAATSLAREKFRGWKLYYAMGWLLPEKLWTWLLLGGELSWARA